MPIYEYDCSACGDRFERIQRFSDPDPETCPACGAASPKRRISESAFHLKGSGWYVTDYARKGADKGGGTAPKAAEPAASSPDAGAAASATSSPAPAPASPAPSKPPGGTAAA